MSTTEKPRPTFERPKRKSLAVRCHDITVNLNGRQSGDFEQLLIGGMAARVALHLRGAPQIRYDVLRQVGQHLLHIPSTTLPAVIDALAEIEFVRVDRQGSTIRSVLPDVPYYEDAFEDVGELIEARGLTEPEQLTLTLVHRLAKGPVSRETLSETGAEKKLLKRMLTTGEQGGYLIERRARGRDIVISPTYFPENVDTFADLAAGHGSGRIVRVVSALSQNQGWPLRLIEQTSMIGATSVSPAEIAVVKLLAANGFSPAPAIHTAHAGDNSFIFAPRPGALHLSPTKRQVYEKAMALIAAVRQGQLLPAAIRIRSPLAILHALKTKKWLRSNTEALEQYRSLALVHRVGRLVKTGSGWYRFELIDTQENLEAVDMAIALVIGSEPAPAVDEDLILAFRQGEDYIESLVGRQLLVEESRVELDPDYRKEVEDLLLIGAS